MVLKTIEKGIIRSVLPNSGRFIGLIILIFAFVFFIISLILFFTLGDNLITENPFPPIFGWQAKTVGGLIVFFGGSIISLILMIGLIIILINKKRSGNIKKVLRFGELKNAVVISNTQNFYIKVNDVPQRVVCFGVDNNTYEYRFYSEEWAAKFLVGSSFKIRCKEKKAYPDPSFLKESN